MTEAQIRAYWKDLHDTLSAYYYAGTSGLSKEEFDTQHGQIWADMGAQLIAEGYVIPPENPRDLATEIDILKTKVSALEKK